MELLICALRCVGSISQRELFVLISLTNLTFDIAAWSFCALPMRNPGKILVVLGSCHQPFDLSLPLNLNVAFFFICSEASLVRFGCL